MKMRWLKSAKVILADNWTIGCYSSWSSDKYSNLCCVLFLTACLVLVVAVLFPGLELTVAGQMFTATAWTQTDVPMWTKVVSELARASQPGELTIMFCTWPAWKATFTKANPILSRKEKETARRGQKLPTAS
jgi:uncharacterized membrane protein